MGKMSREKGKTGERELSHKLQGLGLGDEIRRGRQYSGLDAPDVVGVKGVHIECKRTETLRIYDAMQQAIDEANPGETPVVAHRKNGKEWLVIMRLEDWARMKKKAYPQPPMSEQRRLL
jgi:Holliday junction resolvase